MATEGQEQQPRSKHFSRVRLVILIIAVVLVIASTIAAILTQGSWVSNFSLILAALGVVLALFQLFPLFSYEKSVAFTTSSQEKEIFRKQIEVTLKSGSFGALVIYTKKNFVGRKAFIRMHVSGTKTSNFDQTSVSKRTINRRPIYVAVFPKLKPGIYNVQLSSHWRGLASDYSSGPVYHISEKHDTMITVLPEEVAELDWG